LALVLHLRLVVPAEKVGAVLDCLSSSPAVTNVVHLPGAALEPAGDLVLGDVAREAASEVLETLKGHDLVRLGSISADEVSLSLSDAARAAEQAAPGLGTDAVVWEEVEARTTEESTLSATYLVFMCVATMIAAFGLLLDQPILVVGAMVVGPEFGPLAGLCVAIVQRRPAEARRSLLALVVGFPVGMLATIGLVLLLTATGQLDSSMLTAARPDTSFIYHPDSLSFIVAFLAGIAGMLSLTSAKSGALVGVLISVTTIPAAANVAAGIAYANGHEAAGSAVQLGLNLGGIVLAGTLTLVVQQHAWHRAPATPAT
jgi:uncharacterized hydrophobic protein (TIGR00271 family)